MARISSDLGRDMEKQKKLKMPLREVLEKLSARDRSKSERQRVAAIKSWCAFSVDELSVQWHGEVKGHPVERDPAFSVRLNDQRRIWLINYSQFRTYGGVLEGIPETFVPFFENAINKAHDLFPLDGVKPVILPPKLHQGRVRRPRSWKMVDETWCLLPSITSIGMFDSEGAVDVGSMSSVLLIWFQDRFGNPTEFVKKQIRALDWDRYAHQWDW